MVTQNTGRHKNRQATSLRHLHEVVDGLSVDGEAGGAVGHNALALSGPNGGTQVGLGALAEDAVRTLALRGVARDHLCSGRVTVAAVVAVAAVAEPVMVCTW